jgi:acetyltransferase-like isoleucine patch superfamily enzyme
MRKEIRPFSAAIGLIRPGSWSSQRAVRTEETVKIRLWLPVVLRPVLDKALSLWYKSHTSLLPVILCRNNVGVNRKMPSYIIHPEVQLGDNPEIQDYVIIGVRAGKFESGDLVTRIGRNALIRSHSVIYAGNLIGSDFQTGHAVMIREMNEIGDGVSIGSHSVIEHHVRIGNRARIHSNVFIPEYSILEDDTWIGPNVVFTNALYPLSPGAKANLRGPRVMPGAKIGANATLLPGVVIGRNALVGAGSVVVRDVPEGKVVVGNPARVIRVVDDLTAYNISNLVDGGGGVR